jgi:hypothetical protein
MEVGIGEEKKKKKTARRKMMKTSLERCEMHESWKIRTSSMNKTPGTSSATPCSIYLFTTLLISPLSLSVTSVLPPLTS